ncbi:PH domain-containing protein [Blastococcus tunisiensis]|uniref:Short C-terminal domain-containing protein n=1 Tax=Blastococcus tunisiensis TaxID=1798228 RepID=A0A1I2J5N9_9ACTN|nr:PH domain-containing protein [Blastococcus sp. DSM 46838]SFF50072.1 Short C-terminal domain-containing protein [Blastococcus sp. DSM 46838]
MADASWLPDPGGMHELRYWDGRAWTEHVSDRGTTGQDPLPAELPPPSAAVPPPPVPPAAAAPAGGKVGWRDRLKQVTDQGRALADQGKQKLAEQNAKRTEQWANDPDTLWFGESRNAATSAAGVSTARYRITKDRVWIESGLLGTRTESVPLWAINDMDVRQAVWQRGSDVGDVVLNLEDPSYGARADTFSLSGAVEGTTTGQVVLDNVEGPSAVMDLLAPLISEARQKKTVERQSQYLHVNPGTAGAAFGAPAAPPAAPQPDLADQLRKLADLRDAGVLTEEEFAAQKAKLLA